MAKITYDNKVSLNPQPSIPNINKVSDADMNEIKNSVNTLYDFNRFLETETQIGTWITGKPLYRIVYKAENKASSYSITPPANVNIYATLRVIQLDGDGAFIPDYYWNSTDYLRIFRNNNGIQIRTSKADNTFTHWIILEYTKTTD